MVKRLHVDAMEDVSSALVAAAYLAIKRGGAGAAAKVLAAAEIFERHVLGIEPYQASGLIRQRVNEARDAAAQR